MKLFIIFILLSVNIHMPHCTNKYMFDYRALPWTPLRTVHFTFLKSEKLSYKTYDPKGFRLIVDLYQRVNRNFRRIPVWLREDFLTYLAVNWDYFPTG